MFGKRLNERRKILGYTAQYMADYLNITTRTYRYYESEGREPNFETLVKIADLFNVSTDWLLGRDFWLSTHEASSDECQ